MDKIIIVSLRVEGPLLGRMEEQQMITNSLLLAVGGFFGAISRFGISNWVNKRYQASFPLATFIINVVGAFLLGYIKGKEWGNVGTFLLGTGFMGAFTTFSTFKLENIQLYEKKKWSVMIIYLGFSYTLGILMAFFGLVLGKM